MSNTVKSEGLQRVLEKYTFEASAQQVLYQAFDRANGHVGTENLLIPLLKLPEVIALLAKINLPADKLLGRFLLYLQEDDRAPQTSYFLTPTMINTFHEANVLAKRRDEEVITTLDLLLALFRVVPGGAVAIITRYLGDDIQLNPEMEIETVRSLMSALLEIHAQDMTTPDLRLNQG